MNHRTLPFLLASIPCFLVMNSNAQVVLLYGNQFLTPLDTPSIATWCQQDFSPDPVNSLWGGTGSGTSSGIFQNTQTVETILVTGPADIYDDPSGIGGDYSIGMLNTTFGDKLGLLLDTEGRPFVNVAMDLSAINTTCGGPLPMDTAVFLLEVLDAPGGIFNLGGTAILDADTLTGKGPNVDDFTFNWEHAEGSLDVSGSIDGMVGIRITLIRSGYASFDNLYIQASQDPVFSAIHEERLQNLEAFPVPCAGRLSITGLAPGQYPATIHSITGNVIASLITDTDGTIDVSSLAPGSYLLRLNNGTMSRVVRFVRQ
ncbi:MAG: T9SS type A sorting domain-containing protein [Flavobacteriales bacterium]|nr:T9SS type A sorting domain-containing protein [Flavobacteriales bacterium]MCL4281306.1 T9SS type A sorting domain-containing protein [Flavobacteriales bacterium]